jgi:hypothetical protein
MAGGRATVGGLWSSLVTRQSSVGGWLKGQSSENQCYAHDSPAAESCYDVGASQTMTQGQG